jgi:hypothetical protein
MPVLLLNTDGFKCRYSTIKKHGGFAASEKLERLLFKKTCAE